MRNLLKKAMIVAIIVCSMLSIMAVVEDSYGISICGEMTWEETVA